MIHIFDVDYTIIRKTSTWHFLCEALGAKDCPISFAHIRRLPIDLIKYKLGFPDIDFIENTIKSIEGVDKVVLERIAQDCFKKRVKSDIYTGVVKLIRDAQINGEKVIFATSSFDVIIRPLEVFFDIEGSLTSRLEFCDGKTTGRVVGYSLFGAKKRTAVEQWMRENNIDPASTSFYSDSYTDIPLLEYCGKPVAVNPDRTLAREAKKRGWEIMRFKEVLGKARG